MFECDTLTWVQDSEELDELQKLLDDVRQENNDMRLEIAAASGIIAENEKLKVGQSPTAAATVPE